LLNAKIPQIDLGHAESRMYTVGMQEAAGRLAEWIEEVASGGEVVITHEDGAAFKMIPVALLPPSPKCGRTKGGVKMTEGLDEPLEDLQAHTP
jgi:antitoxin (DNA-binding transcriptional repressor) of toxin-antitoxin stability system